MRSSRVVLVMAVIFLGGLVNSHASVRPYKKLTLDEKVALQESERRVDIYDLQLRSLDRQRVHHKISAEEYRWSNQQLVLCLRQESLFQNAILIRGSDLPLRARDVLETMEHGVLIIPIGVGYVIECCPQVLELLACIH
jgi:alanine dehydrogenase